MTAEWFCCKCGQHIYSKCPWTRNVFVAVDKDVEANLLTLYRSVVSATRDTNGKVTIRLDLPPATQNEVVNDLLNLFIRQNGICVLTCAHDYVPKHFEDYKCCIGHMHKRQQLLKQDIPEAQTPLSK